MTASNEESDGTDPDASRLTPLPMRWAKRVFRCVMDDPDPGRRTGWHWICRAFAFGAFCHLMLLDAWKWSWVPGDVALALGALILTMSGSALGWWLCVAGVAWPLLFGYDQLTQSMIMLVWSLSAALGLTVELCAADDSPGDGLLGAIRAIQIVTALTYAIAVLHKLNAGFFDPSTGCAVYGFREIVEYWHLGIELPGWFRRLSPFLILGAEGSIAASLLLRRHRLAWCIAAPFHLALTFTMAPAFGFVMGAGHVAYASQPDRRRLYDWTKHHWPFVVSGALAVAGLSSWQYGEPVSVTMGLRYVVGWAVCFIVWGVYGSSRSLTWTGTEAPTGGTATTVIFGAACLLFVFNGLTPYLGLQYQHAGAMVSNLRIDRGCWNSLVVPESVRLRDPYIRVDEVYMGEPGRVPHYEQIVRSHLWHPPEIRKMRHNWCEPKIRPFYLSGTYLDEKFVIDDLCAGEKLPFGEWYIGDWAVFGRSFRFQKNLKRTCKQPCVH